MQAVEKPKCETISPWALQGDRKLSLGSQSDQRAKYNAKEVGQNHTDHTSIDLRTQSLSYLGSKHTHRTCTSLFSIPVPWALTWALVRTLIEGKFSFQFPSTGKLADWHQQCLKAFLFLSQLLNHWNCYTVADLINQWSCHQNEQKIWFVVTFLIIYVKLLPQICIAG